MLVNIYFQGTEAIPYRIIINMYTKLNKSINP